MLNQIILSGNLGANPEIFYSGNGDPIATFSFAFKSTKDKTGWIKVTCFNKLAEVVEEYLSKGSRIALVGLLDQDNWTSEDGTKRTAYKIIANSIEFIKTKNDE